MLDLVWSLKLLGGLNSEVAANEPIRRSSAERLRKLGRDLYDTPTFNHVLRLRHHVLSPPEDVHFNALLLQCRLQMTLTSSPPLPCRRCALNTPIEPTVIRA